MSLGHLTSSPTVAALPLVAWVGGRPELELEDMADNRFVIAYREYHLCGCYRELPILGDSNAEYVSYRLCAV